MTIRSSTVVIPTCFSLLYFYTCISLASSQQHVQSVCGPGPHLLNQTVLDVYILPDTSVTFQSIVGPKITWGLIGNRTKTRRLKTQIKGNNLKIGPVDHDQLGTDTIGVKYLYQTGNSTPQSSRRAVLHIAESDLALSVDQGYTRNQVVNVAAGSTQRVFCYRVTPATGGSSLFSTPLDFWLTKRASGSNETVHKDRYHNQNGCLWMTSLQQNDSGRYRQWIKPCVSSHYKSSIEFSIEVIQPTAPPTLRTSTPTNTRHSDGLQGWLVGIIVVIILLVVAIPTVYILYKLRLFCFTRCNNYSIRNQDSDKGQQASNRAFSNANYDTVLNPTVASNTYSNVAPPSTQGTSNVLPDIIAAALAATNNTATVKTTRANGSGRGAGSGSTEPAVAVAGKKNGDDYSTVYATISTPAPMEVQHESPDDRAASPDNQPCTIQYVDLDLDALAKKE